MKILIIGGHLAPALALIEALPKDTQVLYVGRKHALEGDSAFSLEYQTIIKLEIPFEEIKTGRLQRKFTSHTISSLLKMPMGFASAFYILRKFCPDVIVGFGGYLSLPLGIAAKFLGIPLVIHEQALKPGLANKILAKFADKICVSWSETLPFFPKNKTTLTGLPIRQLSTLNSQFSTPKGFPLVYITGGSQGSHFINTLVEQSLTELTQKFSIIHQTGDAKEYGDFDRLDERKSDRYMPIKFVDPAYVGTTINKASLVISRCGINTIAELIQFKKPALLIPIAYLKEQADNALFFESLGAGRIFLQKDSTSQKFVQVINEMFVSLDSYKQNVNRASSLTRENSAHNLIEVIKNVSTEKK